MTTPPESFTCPVCGMTSYNPNDVQHSYCGNCHEWTRPRVGSLRRLDGTVIALRFVLTDDPSRFLAVTVDGDPVEPRHGDQMTVDVIGPGQSVVFGLEADEPAAHLPDNGKELT